MIFGPTLCPPGMFGGVTLCLSCVLLSEDFFAAELIIYVICCNPEKLDKCVYVGLFVSNVLRLSPQAFLPPVTNLPVLGALVVHMCILAMGRILMYLISFLILFLGPTLCSIYIFPLRGPH